MDKFENNLYINIQTYAKYVLSKQVSEILGVKCSGHYVIEDSNWRHFEDEFDVFIKIETPHERNRTFSFARSKNSDELLNLEGVKDIKFSNTGLGFIFDYNYLINEEFQLSMENLLKSISTVNKYNLK